MKNNITYVFLKINPVFYDGYIYLSVHELLGDKKYIYPLQLCRKMHLCAMLLAFIYKEALNYVAS